VTVALALQLMLFPLGWLSAGEPPSAGGPPESATDHWHRIHRYYFMEEEEPAEQRFRFGLCPGIGLRAGSPGTVFAVTDLYVSVTRRRAFSLFAGAGVEGTNRLRSAVFTLGWGGVRRIHVARRQTGFFGAFLRYRDFVGEVGTTRDDAVSVGTELGAGHMGLTFEVGASRRVEGNWKLLVYVGYKLIWASPLGW